MSIQSMYVWTEVQKLWLMSSEALKIWRGLPWCAVGRVWRMIYDHLAAISRGGR